MSFWKTLTTNSLRVYFPVKLGGSLFPNLSPNLFTALLINPDDTDSSSSAVVESLQRPGIYYTDIDSQFLIDNGIGMYGLSIGIHKGPPNRIDDEVLFSIEVTDYDISQLNVKLNDLWQLHGLDPDSEVTVDQAGRTVANIEQVFTKVGGTVKINRQ